MEQELNTETQRHRGKSERFLLLTLFLCVSVFSLPAFERPHPSNPATPKGYVCYRIDKPINIDGKLDEDEWRHAPWTDLFVDIEGDSKPRPRFATRVKMLWDDKYFYIGAELEEPHVWATLTKRDSVIFHDNDFEIFIDPDGDNLNYYELEINALNTPWDLLLKRPYRDGGPPVNSWDIAGLKTAVHINGTLNDPTDIDKEWSVEMALPWQALAEYANRPSPPKDGDQWRINFSRVEWQVDVVDGKYHKVPKTREDNWVWSPQGVVDMHRPEKWGYVQFSTGRFDQVKFNPDPDWPIRETLIRVYYAERAYKEKHQAWTSKLDELGLNNLDKIENASSPSIRLTGEGYEVTIESRRPNKKTQIWHIRQDSRIWAE